MASLAKTFRVLGLDIGIASIGWAILEFAASAGRVVAAGVYAFQAPEEKDSSGRAAASNKKRHGDLRRRQRQTSRRAERLSYLRRALYQHEPRVLPDSGRHALAEALRRRAKEKGDGITPWRLRAEGLARKLSGDEWSVVLGHLVGHRAYRSNRKRAASNDGPGSGTDDGAMLSALKENDREFTQAAQRGEVKTVGEWLARFERQRNRVGDYRFSIKREWVLEEARLLFAKQRDFHSNFASPKLQQIVEHLIHDQKPIGVRPVEKCTFEPDKDRAPRHGVAGVLHLLRESLLDGSR